MWTRRDLKEKAKVSIRNKLWLCIGITLVYSIFCGNMARVEMNLETNQPQFALGLSSYNTMVFAIGFAIFFFLSILFIILSIFVFEPIKVGHHRFYLEHREEASTFTALLYVFKSGYYWNVVKTLFLMNLYTALWTLLLVIPGIYKAYEYRMIPYILADNPSLPPSRIFELTCEMTYHQKFDMFILDISFIGWYLLGIITCGLGFLVLNPYIEATNVELYVVTRDELLDRQFASYDEFIGFSREV